MLQEETKGTRLWTSAERRPPRTSLHVAHVALTHPQCNRRYPCNQCTKRRQPEACTYHTSQASHQTPAPQPDNRVREDVRIEAPQPDLVCGEVAASSTDWTKTKGRSLDRAGGSLAGMFAYVEHSESNTLALVLKVRHYTSP